MKVDSSVNRVDNSSPTRAAINSSSKEHSASFQTTLSLAVGNIQTPQPNSIWSPNQGRWIEPTEVKRYLASNPTDRSLLAKAAELGLSEQDLNTALRGQGYTGEALGKHFNRLSFNLFNGALGYSSVKEGFFAGKIVSGGGHSLQDNGSGGLSWKYGTASTGVFTTAGHVADGKVQLEANWNENNLRVFSGSA